MSGNLPRQVTTYEELEALPDESVILDRGGVAWQKSHGTFDGKGKWFAAKRDSGFYYSDNFFDRVPITVLHEAGLKS